MSRPLYQYLGWWDVFLYLPTTICLSLIAVYTFLAGEYHMILHMFGGWLLGSVYYAARLKKQPDDLHEALTWAAKEPRDE